MIYVSGVATFLLNQTQKNEKFIRKKKTLSLALVGQLEQISDSHQPVKARYKFRVILPESIECRSLEDYTGKIKPFLQKSTNATVISVEVHHLNYTDRRKID